MKEARLWGAGGDPSSVMQHGGSQYGAPPPDHMAPFAPGTSAQQQPQPLAEAASPISSRAPPRAGGLEELPPGAPGGFPDEDALVAAAGEEAAERGGAPGNRWPRQETLALLKIRSEMDAVFRDATLKAPLWEDVSRKLAELGYKRSAKKCKEKFENVHKYYKRTKDGRAGRQDGKSYRFFSQLEALHSSGGAAPAPATGSTAPNTVTSSLGMVGSSSGPLQPTPLNTIPPAVGTAHRGVSDPPMAAVSGPSGGISFSVTSSSSASESEEDTEEGLTGQPRKRKRRGGGGSGRKMMTFFEELMRQVMERQEAMQQRFLEAIEKREQDRMIREEAWKRQEVARLSREHDMMTQERAMSASRDAAIIAFLQKITGQTIPVPEAATPRPQPPSQQYPPPAPVSPPPPEQTRPPPPQRSQGQQPQLQVPPETAPVLRTQASTLDIVPASETLEVVASGAGGSGMDPASSRWPKSEVHALIKLRSELEARYQDAGPKGPLWEEVATRMQRMGYNRSAKRCKEKWENINKYFKKVKESNKKRPEDSKTCPYFHQLDALYRRKLVGSGGGVAESSSSDRPKQQALVADDPHKQPPPPQQAETEGEGDGGGGGSNNSNGGGNPGRNGGSSSSGQKIQTSNGGLKPGISFDEGVGGGGSAKKPEDTVKEYLMDQPQQRRQHQAIMMGADYDKSDELDTDEDVDEHEEDQGMHYRIHYQQKAGVNATSSNGAAAAGSFMAMMQ